MSSLKNKDRHISDKPSVLRLLDLSSLQPLLLGRPQPSFSASLHVISGQAGWLISDVYSEPCQISKSR